MKKIKIPKKVKCHKCKYIWFTKSELKTATCSSCQAKVKINEK